jgi:hypothetical protein
MSFDDGEQHCPLSNLKLKIVFEMKKVKMLLAGFLCGNAIIQFWSARLD